MPGGASSSRPMSCGICTDDGARPGSTGYAAERRECSTRQHYAQQERFLDAVEPAYTLQSACFHRSVRFSLSSPLGVRSDYSVILISRLLQASYARPHSRRRMTADRGSLPIKHKQSLGIVQPQALNTTLHILDTDSWKGSFSTQPLFVNAPLCIDCS